jgi:hypothetical protein
MRSLPKAGLANAEAHGYHLIIYGIQPIFAPGTIKACNGR